MPGPPLAVVYGGGGLFGIGYLLGIAEALVDAGVPLATAPSVGTSAGSWAAAAVALGITWSSAVEAIGADVPRVPDPRTGRLREVATCVFDERRVPTMRAMVCDLPRLRRTALAGSDHAVADLVAASSAVPGLFAPHRVGGRRYVDGGVRSIASPDLADAAENLLVIAPLAGPMFGPGGRLAERILRREMGVWRSANPTSQVWLIRPNHAVAALARRPGQLFDLDRALACHTVAYDQGVGIRDRWAARYGARP